jgi:hypothetical protein
VLTARLAEYVERMEGKKRIGKLFKILTRMT